MVELTEVLIGDLAAAIRTGVPVKLACQGADIDVSTFLQWRAGRFSSAVPEDLRRRFVRAIRQAEAQALHDALVTVRRASVEDVPADVLEAALRVLDRYPEYGGGRPADVVAGDIGDDW